MPLFGLTRTNSARKSAIANLIKELALINKDFWRVPIEERKALVASMRISCNVPDHLGDLDPLTLELVQKGDGIQTRNAFKDAALWIKEAQEFVDRVGEKRLDQLQKANPVAKLDKDLEDITEVATE